jgi:hypothetical protein
VETSVRRVPFGVWVAAILEALLFSLLLLDAAGIRESSSSSIIATLSGQGGVASVLIGGVAVVGIASAVALVRLLPVGLIVTTLLAGLGLVNELGSRLEGHSDDLRLAILVAIVLYLNQPAVREAFGQDDPSSRAATPRGSEGE